MNAYLSKKMNYLSFLAILGVVLCHAYNWQDRFLTADTALSEGLKLGPMLQLCISNGLIRFAVPLFFAFSGYKFFMNFSFSWKGYLKKLGKRVRTLLVPFLIWTVLAGALLLTVYKIAGLERYGIVEEKVGNLLNYGPVSWLFDSPAFQLWYMTDLFKLVVISPVIYFLVKKCRIVPVIIFGILWLMNMPFMINMDGMLFFTLGAYLAVQQIPLAGREEPERSGADWERYRRNTILVVVLWIGGCLVYTIISAAVGQAAFAFYVLTALFKLNVLTGIASVWRLYDLKAGAWQEKPWLQSAVASTVFIYVSHEPVQHLLMDVLLEKMDFPGAHTLIYFGLAFCVVCVDILVAGLLQKVCPKVYGILVGGRSGK